MWAFTDILPGMPRRTREAGLTRSLNDPPVPAMTTFASTLLVLPLLFAPASAAEASLKMEAPPLKECRAQEHPLPGPWDDAHAPQDQDFMVLRRDDTLFELPMMGAATPRPLAKEPRLERSRIVGSAMSGKRLWLFMDSGTAAPFAIEARSGRIESFEIPGLTVPGDQLPVIQSIHFHPDSVLLTVSGGDGASWPRDGNRPVYFWFGLESGKTIRFPIGWDPNFFSADMATIVFSTVQMNKTGRRVLQTIDLRTGNEVPGAPNRQAEAFVPEVWTDTQEVKALYRWRPGHGEATYFSGIAHRGKTYPCELALDGIHYLGTAKAHDGIVGFQLRKEGTGGHLPWPLWLLAMNGDTTPKRVAENITGFSLLDGGSSILVSSGHGHLGKSSEAVFRSNDGKTSWNLLDGVPRLPELPQQLKDQESIQDQLSIQLVEGSGKGRRLTLGIFTQARGDLHSGLGERDHVPHERWRRAILLDSDGNRYLTDQLRGDGSPPDRIWLHDSRRLVMTKHLWGTGSWPRHELTVVDLDLGK